MSSHQTHDTTSSRTPLGKRGNWWGDGSDSPDDPGGDDEQLGHVELQGVSREEFIAGRILRSAGDPVILCPECYDQGITAELSEPEDYVPPAIVELDDGDFSVRKYQDHRRHRHCTNPDCGYISWGGILQDRPAGKFLEIVDQVLDLVGASTWGLQEDVRDEIYREAMSRKHRGMGDEQNMQLVVRDIEHPDHLRDD